MYRFIKIVTDYKDYLVFIILVVVSFSLISFNSTSEIGGFRTVVAVTFGKLQKAFSWVSAPIVLQNENRTLIELNIQLSSEVTAMRQAMSENTTLRNMLELKQKSQYPLEACDVVNKSLIQLHNLVTINKGSSAGIKIGMSVMSVAGLVGIVIGVNENYAIVELLNNKNVKVPAISSSSKCEGIINWQEGDFLYMNYVSKTQQINVGETISTSLFSNIYPENVIIGKVHKVENDNSSHFRKIWVKPAVAFFNFTQLFVIKYVKNSKELELIENMENKILELRRSK